MSSPYRMHTNALYSNSSVSPSRAAPLGPGTVGLNTSGGGGGSSSAQFQYIQDLASVNTKLRAMDDRVDSVERTVAKVLAKVDQTVERMDADNRAVELLRISLREVEQNMSLAQTRSQSICDRAVSDVTSLSQRLDEQESCMRNSTSDIRGLKRALEALESACGALQSQRQTLQAELGQEVQSVESRMNSQLRGEVAECHRKISQSVRVVQQHVKTTVTGLNDTVGQRMSEVQKDHEELVDIVRTQQAQSSGTADKLGELRGDVEVLSAGQRRSDLSHTHLEEDMKTLNRRLMSALRHLSTSSSASLGAGGVGSSPSVQQQVNSYLGGSGGGTQGAAVPDLTVSRASPHRSYSPNPAHRDRSVHDGLVATSGGDGGGPTPDIDQFLSQLDGMTRTQLGMA